MCDKMLKFLLSQIVFYIPSQIACNRTKPVCDYRVHCGNVKDFFHYLYFFFLFTLADVCFPETWLISLETVPFIQLRRSSETVHARGVAISQRGEFCAQSIPPVRTDKQDKCHLPFPHPPVNGLAKCALQRWKCYHSTGQ